MATVPVLPSPAEKGNNPISGNSVAHDYGGGRFEISPHGVFFIGTDKDGNELSALDVFPAVRGGDDTGCQERRMGAAAGMAR